MPAERFEPVKNVIFGFSLWGTCQIDVRTVSGRGCVGMQRVYRRRQRRRYINCCVGGWGGDDVDYSILDLTDS